MHELQFCSQIIIINIWTAWPRNQKNVREVSPKGVTYIWWLSLTVTHMFLQPALGQRLSTCARQLGLQLCHSDQVLVLDHYKHYYNNFLESWVSGVPAEELIIWAGHVVHHMKPVLSQSVGNTCSPVWVFLSSECLLSGFAVWSCLGWFNFTFNLTFGWINFDWIQT